MPPSAAAERPGDAPAGDTPGSALAIRTRGLTKRFGEVAAVDGIDLAVPRGSVFGFLGPNGSGKTTTIRMLLGLIHPTSGNHEILGRPVPGAGLQALHRVGSLVEGPAFHRHLSGPANLRRLDAADSRTDAASSPARIGAALERVGLNTARGKRYRAYSLGMKQRLAIAAALLTQRELLILDEPTNGLDPQGTREVRHLVADLTRDGITVFVSSHLLSEIEQICTHLGVMSAGHLVAQGPIGQIRQAGEPVIRVDTPDVSRCAQVLRTFGLAEPETVGQAVTARPAAGGQVLAEPERLVAALVAAQVRVRGFRVQRQSLEDIYVALTGEGFEVRG